MIDELVEKYFKEFESLPANIVRTNTKNDAFPIVVLQALYGSLLKIDFTKANVNEIAKYVIAPPDSSIDIFYQSGDEEDASFDIIQVKYADYNESQIKACFASMKDTIKKYLESPTTVKSTTCRKILMNSELIKQNMKNCTFYVVHTGNTRCYQGLASNEKILNNTDLELLLTNNTKKVREHILNVGEVTEFNRGSSNSHGLVCNLNCYDVATLNNNFYSTRIGRNILYGMNLRDSLAGKNKAFSGMDNTINTTPENFWFYNNGITIIAEQIDKLEDGKFKLHNFSIVNGAQTSSSLGLMLSNAEESRNNEKIEKLKRAYVLTRILVVNDENVQKNIAIYNNTQNPITSRDMVSNNEEQTMLFDRLNNSDYPQIYMEIRRGNEIPDQLKKKYKHRFTTNEELAQLAYAGFYLQPFNSKDKKANLFAKDYSQTDYPINKYYSQIFNYNKDNPDLNGILFRKSKIEIDELLFIRYIYNIGKNYLKNEFQEQIDSDKAALEIATDPDEIKNIQERLQDHSGQKETVGICGFYFLAAYYELKAQCSQNSKRYDIDSFYNDKEYRQELIENFSDYLLMLTIELLVETALASGNGANINTWIRKAECQTKFLEALRKKINFDRKLKKNFEKLLNDYKTI